MRIAVLQVRRLYSPRFLLSNWQ
jgi:hypothetical protein